MNNTQQMLPRIKMLKKQQNLTNEELAKLTDIPLSTLSKIISGITKDPQLSNIMKIAHVLGTTTDYLVFGEADSEPSVPQVSPEELQIIEDIRKLSDIGRDTLMTTLSNILNYEALYEPEPKSIFRFRVPYYPEPVSAGTGQYLDYTSLQTLTINTTPPIGADFILRVIGDSMEPEYPDGGLVFVRIQKTIEIGDVGIFFSEGNVYMKGRGENGLESLNKKYPTIEGDKDIKCIGKVVGKLSWSNVVE